MLETNLLIQWSNEANLWGDMKARRVDAQPSKNEILLLLKSYQHYWFKLLDA